MSIEQQEENDEISEVDSASEIDTDDDFDLYSSSETEEEDFVDDIEGTDFDEQENEFTVQFPKRMSCIDHGIQLVTSKVVENYGPTKSIIKTVRKQIKKIRSSPKLKSLVKQKTGRVPILPSVTRWSGTVLMLRVYLPMAEDLKKVCLFYLVIKI